MLRKVLLLTVLSATAAFAQKPMTARDLWSLGRVGNPVISPDGGKIAYTVTRYDLDAFKSKTEIFTIPITGGAPTLVTTGSSPAWSPKGELAFTRGGKIFIGEREVASGSGPLVWSRDGTKLLFTNSVEVGPSPARPNSEVKIYDELAYRHWDEWEDGLRNHVFVLDVATGKAVDVTPGAHDAPPIALEGFADYSISPDGGEVAFTRNTDVATMVGTGNDIWVVPAVGGEPKLITPSDANENSPQYSPDGRYIAYLGMTRAGFESDRTQLMLYDRKTQQHRSLTRDLDLSVDFYTWSPDSKTIHFLAGDDLDHSVFRVGMDGKPLRLSDNTYNSGLAVAGKNIIVARQAVDKPVELYTLEGKQLTNTNDLRNLALQPAERFTFTGAEGAKVEGFIVKPPGFDASRKYPVVYLIHGGPQGVWANSWSYRWNPNMFAAPGYVVVAVNPRGSTGYGQKFTDEISADWGGKAYTDLMNGIDHVLATYPYMDKDRVAAAGASYGGYMINWINGHTNRFKALINHDGIYNTESMYGSTEELWFPEWEFKGTPWEKPEEYQKWNPARYAQFMRTPTLVIHGGLDYRVPLEQGLMTFSALRRQGVPSRLVYFPDECHWVLKPQNAFVWWDNMLGWLNTYIGPAAATF